MGQLYGLTNVIPICYAYWWISKCAPHIKMRVYLMWIDLLRVWHFNIRLVDGERLLFPCELRTYPCCAISLMCVEPTEIFLTFWMFFFEVTPNVWLICKPTVREWKIEWRMTMALGHICCKLISNGLNLYLCLHCSQKKIWIRIIQIAYPVPRRPPTGCLSVGSY